MVMYDTSNWKGNDLQPVLGSVLTPRSLGSSSQNGQGEKLRWPNTISLPQGETSTSQTASCWMAAWWLQWELAHAVLVRHTIVSHLRLGPILCACMLSSQIHLETQRNHRDPGDPLFILGSTEILHAGSSQLSWQYQRDSSI